MIKYLGYTVTFQEIPDEVTLCFNITNCPHRCIGCHSPELQQDVGKDLEPDILPIINKYFDGITCVCFMGEGNDLDALLRCMYSVSNNYPDLKIALYTGLDNALDTQYVTGHHTDRDIHEPLVSYLKIGKYDPDKGGLSNPSTNQRLLYHDYIGLENFFDKDITSKFWQKGFHNDKKDTV